MKSRALALLALATLATSIGILTSSSAQSQLGVFKQSVGLQPTTPGTAQSGHANISGVMTATQFVGNFTTPTGASAGRVLTSDATGNASWQPVPPPTFPMTGSTNAQVSTLTLQGSTVFPTLRVQNSAVNGPGAQFTGGSTGLTAEATSSLGTAGTFYGMGKGVYGQGSEIGVDGWGNGINGIGLRGEGGTGVEGIGSGGLGVNGLATGPSATGVRGTADGSNAIGVRGTALAQTGTIYGVVGNIAATTAVAGAGVRGIAQIPSGGIGVEGFTDSFSGIAVSGLATVAQSGTTSRGGSFESRSPAGFGVVGLASSTGSGATFGGSFQSNSTGGRGVYGYTPALTGFTYGVFGVADSVDGRGVYGFAGSNTGTPYGVYGRAPTASSGYAVYANGDFGATGVKSFRIDHPADPINKYLVHFAAESPFPQNFYSGNVVTDQDGYAWVDLPDYFESINTNLKYQLTVLGKSFARAVVWDEVENGRFRIRTDEPNIKVSWRIEADRDDAYVKFKKPKDVVEKRASERGKFLVPEIYGESEERGLDYLQNPAIARKP